MLHTVAYAEAADQEATRDFASSDISLGDQAKIEQKAALRTDELMEELQSAMEMGPVRLQQFIDDQEARKDRARTSLQKKLGEAAGVGKRWESVFGTSIKVLAVLKFGATVTVKTVSIFTGGAGTAIDVVYSGAQAGVAEAYAPSTKNTVLGVVVEETAKNVEQELAESLNEAAASGAMTKAEKNLVEGLIGNYKGNSEKIAEELIKIEDRLKKALRVAPGGTKVAGIASQRLKKLEKLKALRIQTAKGIMGKGAKGFAKKGAGHALSLVFLASEVKDAWKEFNKDYAASN